jgi:hypothetical protein
MYFMHRDASGLLNPARLVSVPRRVNLARHRGTLGFTYRSSRKIPATIFAHLHDTFAMGYARSHLV